MEMHPIKVRFFQKTLHKCLIVFLLFCTIFPLAIAQNLDGGACPLLPSVADIDGNLYATVQIGKQCWMKENLRTLHYADGAPISLSDKDFNYKTAYVYKPSDGAPDGAGLLYNWSAATRSLHSSATPSGVQGVCPDGWHIPSADEWQQLLDYVGTNPLCRQHDNEVCIAKSLAAPMGWVASADSFAVGNRQNLNDLTGFSAIPAGAFINRATGAGVTAGFWSSSVNNYGGAAYLLIRSYLSAPVLNTYDQRVGRSVRCLHNSPVALPKSAALPVADTLSLNRDGLPCRGDSAITDVDGNRYPTVTIGRQCWMKQNLRVTHTPDGKEIKVAKEKNGYKPLMYYPNDSLSNVPLYGCLYNWCAAMNGASSSSRNPSQVQGVCPNGWHLPSLSEWQQLADYISAQPQFAPNGSKDAADIALAADSLWLPSSYISQERISNQNVKSSGFAALPAGLYEEFYNGFGEDAYFWSSTSLSKTLSFLFAIGNSQRADNIYYYYCGDGFSVRCLRDE